MNKLTNATMSVNDVDSVRQLACELLSEINAIQFVLTEQEQRGLYSIIRNLEFATWDFDQEPGEPRFTDRQLADIQSSRLRELIEQSRRSNITPERQRELEQILNQSRRLQGDQDVD